MARSAAAEIHSGFSALRSFDTNFVAKYTGEIPVSDQALKDIERVLKVWENARELTVKRLEELGEEDEGFLFGAFGIADAFYWPVLWVWFLIL